MATEIYGSCDSLATEVKAASCVDQLSRIDSLTDQVWGNLMAIRETISPRPPMDGQAAPAPVGIYGKLVAHADSLAEMARFVVDIRRQMGG